MSIIERAGLHHGTGSPAQLRPSWRDLLQPYDEGRCAPTHTTHCQLNSI